MHDLAEIPVIREVLLNRLDVFPQDQKTSSHVYPYIADLAPQVMEVSGKVVPMFKDSFEKFDKLFGLR